MSISVSFFTSRPHVGNCHRHSAWNFNRAGTARTCLRSAQDVSLINIFRIRILTMIMCFVIQFQVTEQNE